MNPDRKNEARELAGPVIIEVPSRWVLHGKTQPRETSVAQLRAMGETFTRSAEAVGGLYLRMTDHIRAFGLDTREISKALTAAGWKSSRISELKRVAFAPDGVYSEFSAARLGFRLALRQARLWHHAGRDRAWLLQRQIRRASSRLVGLWASRAMPESWEYRANGYRLLVERELDITNIVHLIFVFGDGFHAH